MTRDNSTLFREPRRPAGAPADASEAPAVPAPVLYRFLQALGQVLGDLLDATARLEHVPSLAQGDGQLRRIHDTVELLGNLRAEFLGLLALSAPQARARPCLVDVGSVCRQVVDLLQPEAMAAEVRLSLRAPASMTGWTDPSLLTRTLRTLVSNAIRYNQPGGHAVVCARVTALGGVQLRVWDSGLGLSASQQARLFQPFERLGKELCMADGTGMGLALAQRMAALMGATLSVRSRPGRGSVFRLDLPSSCVTQAAAAA
ncbi:sensor histidine kinase [Aquabacterium soli]|nr:HAMP domain-containing sensor histidine kinase [Aquabacterium soli]